MLVTRDFFRMQLEFAAYITSVTDTSLGAAIMDYTNIYIRLGFGRDFGANNLEWLEYVGGLRSTPASNARYTYEVWQSRAEVQPPDVIAISGCFSCGYESGNTARIHFENREGEKESPLSYSQQEMRYAELRELFRFVLTSHPEIENVCGLSWLYNISAYQRLFPPEYIASSKPVTGKYRNMPLWGQFLCRNGEVRTDKADLFYEKLSQNPSLSEISTCFPLQPLAVKSPVKVFQHYFDIY